MNGADTGGFLKMTQATIIYDVKTLDVPLIKQAIDIPKLVVLGNSKLIRMSRK